MNGVDYHLGLRSCQTMAPQSPDCEGGAPSPPRLGGQGGELLHPRRDLHEVGACAHEMKDTFQRALFRYHTTCRPKNPAAACHHHALLVPESNTVRLGAAIHALSLPQLCHASTPVVLPRITRILTETFSLPRITRIYTKVFLFFVSIRETCPERSRRIRGRSLHHFTRSSSAQPPLLLGGRSR